MPGGGIQNTNFLLNVFSGSAHFTPGIAGWKDAGEPTEAGK